MLRPTPTEIRVPFQVGPHGGIDFTIDPVIQAIQHITSAVVTGFGERVMRPTYGTDIYSSVFESDDPNTTTPLVSSIEQAIRAYVPSVIARDVRVGDKRPDDGMVQFFISFSLVGREGEIHEASIQVGGTVFEQTYSRGT